MTFALQTGLFFRRKLLEALRQPVWIITGLTTPLLYLALFTPLLNSLAGAPGFPSGHVLDVFVPGVLVLIAFGAGMGAGWPVIWELDSGVIERLRVTPASRLALLLGTVIRDIVMFLVPGVVIIVVASVAGFHAHWGGLAALLVLLSLLTAACSATSSALGLNLKQIGSLAAVVTGYSSRSRCWRASCCRCRSARTGCACSGTSTRCTTRCRPPVPSRPDRWRTAPSASASPSPQRPQRWRSGGAPAATSAP